MIPLADAFRVSFIKEMVGLTKLVQKLTISCYIIGVGVSMDFENRMKKDGKTGFEAESRAFIKAVLEKSSVVGVRGESTGDFLKHLGFVEDRDDMVIGCPSFYTYGTHLKIQKPKIRPDVPTAFNMSCYSTPETIQFLMQSAQSFQDATFVPQMADELKLLYLGMDYVPPNAKREAYPYTIQHPLYVGDKVRFFLNLEEWLDFMKTKSFVFGTRFHGNAVVTISGVPALLITKDVRMRELAAFHKLSYIDQTQLSQYRDIWEMIAETDFQSPEVGHRVRFARYIDFLHQNGLKTIYDQDLDRVDAPLDVRMNEKSVKKPIESVVTCDRMELLARTKAWSLFLETQKKNLKQNETKLKAKLKKYEKQVFEFDRKQDVGKGQIHTLEQENEQLMQRLAEAVQQQKHCQEILQYKPVRAAIRLKNLTLSKDEKIRLE